jgi:hypothetical protein
MKAKWSLLAVYENADARHLIVQFCDRLMQRFWSQLSFDLAWYDWGQLEDENFAQEARAKARAADLIILATAPRGILSPHIKGWLELALVGPGGREGVLVGLPAPGIGVSAENASTQAYLRKLAHRIGMDYLSDVPQSLPICEPDSAEAYNQRATQVTSVMDQILKHSVLPPRLL